MAVTTAIPLPPMGYQALDEGLSNSQSIFNSLINNKKVEAETRKADAMAKLPFGGASVPGPAGQIVGLEMVKQLYGENSQQYKTALGAFNLSQQSTGSRINYQDALRNSMPIRYTTNEGRQQIERSNVGQGYSPAGTPAGQPVTPNMGQPNFYPQGSAPQTPQTGSQNPNDPLLTVDNQQPENIAANQYDLRMAKNNIPAQVLNKNLYATNIEKTLSSIDAKALAYYNNPLGQMKLSVEKAKDAAGQQTSPEYKAYVKSEALFNLLPGQVRQFYGDSVQPSESQKRADHLDPRMNWGSSETGINKFNSASDLLRNELKTYRDAGTSTAVYRGNAGNNLPAQTTHAQVRTADGQPAVLMYKGNRQYTIPLKDIDNPKLKGFTLAPR